MAFKTITPPAAAEARVVDLLDDDKGDEEEAAVDDEAVFGACAAAIDADGDVREKIVNSAEIIRVHDRDDLRPRWCGLTDVLMVLDFID